MKSFTFPCAVKHLVGQDTAGKHDHNIKNYNLIISANIIKAV